MLPGYEWHGIEHAALWQVTSDDGGENWYEPVMTPMWGYPTSTVLEDGRVLTVYWDEDIEGVTSIAGSFYRA